MSYNKAINYGLTLKGAPYCLWSGDGLSDSSPAWSGSGYPPNNDVIFKNGMFCTGLVNLMLRSLNIQCPQNPPWNGGTMAYWMKFHDKMIIFDIKLIRRGDALFRRYQDINDQGHIAIALGGYNDPILQCFSWGSYTVLPGVNDNFNVRQSHCGWYYTHIIRREDLWQ